MKTGSRITVTLSRKTSGNNRVVTCHRFVIAPRGVADRKEEQLKYDNRQI